MKGFAMRGVGMIAVLFCTGSALAETLESVEKTIIGKVGGYTSYQGRITTTQSLQTDQMKYESHGDFAYECLKQGDKWLYRAESKEKSRSVAEGEDVKEEIIRLKVSDGDFVWTLTDIDGEKSIIKARAADQSDMVLMDQAYFETLHQIYDLKLLSDETVSGKATWVIQATPRTAVDKGQAATVLMYFDQETGLNLKTVGKDAAGKVIMTNVKEVKVNIPVPAERFVFKAPEGVEVFDATEPEPGATSQSATQPASPATQNTKTDSQP